MKTSRIYTANDIVELNNAAILKMRQRDHATANLLLHEALENLKDILESSSSSSSSSSVSDSDSSCSQAPRKRPRTSLDQQNSCWMEQDKTATVPVLLNKKVGILFSVRTMDQEGMYDESSVPTDNILTFYDRALVFLNYEDIDFTTAENRSSLSAMLLYNLAVSHHSCGIRQGCTNELDKALRFYRLAHCVLEKVKDVVGLEVHMLILMGLLNNMGHIHANCFNMEQISRCIEWLQRAITSRHSGVLEDVDYEFFYTHLKVIPVDHLKFAPAA